MWAEYGWDEGAFGAQFPRAPIRDLDNDAETGWTTAMLAAADVSGITYAATCHYHPEVEADVSRISAGIPDDAARRPIQVGSHTGQEISWPRGLVVAVEIPEGFCAAQALWGSEAGAGAQNAARRFVDSFHLDVERWHASVRRLRGA